MVRASVCLLAGVFAPQLSRFPAVSDLLILALVLVGLLLPWLHRRDLVLVGVGAALFLISVDHEKGSRLDPVYAGDSMLSVVRVVDFPRVDGVGVTFEGRAEDDSRLPQRVRLYWRQSPVAVRAGDIWQLEIRLRRPRAASNPGGIDYEAWSTQQRIGATGYVVEGTRNRLLDSGTSRGIERARLSLAERIDGLSVGRDARAVITALTLGTRHAISSEQWQRYASTGTTHLMAISGLHVGLLAGSVYAATLGLLSLLKVPHPHQASLVIGLASAAVYVSLSGFAVPARRALLMLALATFCLLQRRRVSAARVLAWAAFLIVATDPLSTLSAGFRLSFAAVGLLAWFGAERGGGATSPLLRAAAALWRVQLVLLCGLLPLSVLSFDRFAVLAPVVNLLAVPLFGLCTVPLALFGLLLDGPLRVLGDGMLLLAAVSVVGLESVIALAGSKQSSVVGAISGLGWLLLLLPLAWAVFPRGWPGRSIAWVALIGLAIWRPERSPAGCADVTVLDVGQGQAVVVETEREVLLYDTGPGYRDGGSSAERVLLPYLQSRGIRHIDRLVVSHADLDHAGGLHAVLAAVSVGRVITGEPIEAVTSTPCRSGDEWSWSGIGFRILHPRDSADGNDASCVLLIEAGERRALLTGDIEWRSESSLLRDDRLPNVDVATMPHHGSRTSSTPAFVRHLSVDWAIASVGFDNRWGFPKPDIVARWRSGGAEVLTTATSGAVTARLCVDGRPIDVRQHRRDTWRSWHED